MKTFLIAHCPRHQPWAVGHRNVGQKSINARNEQNARRRFAREYPDRIITEVGIKGQS